MDLVILKCLPDNIFDEEVQGSDFATARAFHQCTQETPLKLCFHIMKSIAIKKDIHPSPASLETQCSGNSACRIFTRAFLLNFVLKNI
jgi:hypothetical protein